MDCASEGKAGGGTGLDPVAREMDFYRSSGILAKVPGDLIAQGSRSLPRPAADQPPRQAVFVEVPDVGAFGPTTFWR